MFDVYDENKLVSVAIVASNSAGGGDGVVFVCVRVCVKHNDSEWCGM